MSESKKKRNVHLPEFKAKVGLEALGGMKTEVDPGVRTDLMAV